MQTAVITKKKSIARINMRKKRIAGKKPKTNDLTPDVSYAPTYIFRTNRWCDPQDLNFRKVHIYLKISAIRNEDRKTRIFEVFGLSGFSLPLVRHHC